MSSAELFDRLEDCKGVSKTHVMYDDDGVENNSVENILGACIVTYSK